MDDQTKQILIAALGGLIRHGLTAAAGVLVSLGALQPAQTGAFEDIGAGIALWLVAYAWSYIQKRTMIKSKGA